MALSDLGPGDLAILEDIATKAAEQTVRKFSVAMGIDPDDPMGAQQDMQWVRKMRKRAEGIHGKAIMATISFAVLGALNAIWGVAKQLISAGPPSIPTIHN